jgi:DNA-binding MarR family transcriptional regulator
MSQSYVSEHHSFGRGARIIIIADNAAIGAKAQSLAEAAGARVRSLLDVQSGSDWLEEERPFDACLCSLTEEPDARVDHMLRLANRHTKRDATSLMITTTLPLIDRLMAQVDDPHATFLCAADESEQLAAYALEFNPSAPSLSDISTDLDPQRLRRLADEVSRIARSLASLSGTPRPPEGYASAAVSDVHQSFRAQPFDLAAPIAMPTPEEIRRLLRLRRLRENFFDPSLFADPAWDMLLDLMAARLEQAQVAVSSLCIAAAVPPTTALRWIKAMTDHGLFERCADPDDGRRIFIRLSDTATQAMARYFETAKKHGGLVI